MQKLIVIICVLSVVLFSCNSKPSDEEIREKILYDYVCMETAKVNALKVTDSKETKTIMGGKAYQFTVSGEIEWPRGCPEFGANLPAGYEETFTGKRVFLAKTDEGWQ